MHVTTLGIDLAKHMFQLHGVDDRGNAVLSRRVRRHKLMEVVTRLPPCVIGMEACASAHHWRRAFEQCGHTVKLMDPKNVKPYVKTNKNDCRDAEAICECKCRDLKPDFWRICTDAHHDDRGARRLIASLSVPSPHCTAYRRISPPDMNRLGIYKVISRTRKLPPLASACAVKMRYGHCYTSPFGGVCSC
jgi:hypothetical protein